MPGETTEERRGTRGLSARRPWRTPGHKLTMWVSGSRSPDERSWHLGRANARITL